jgi:hypothetical protein
MVERPIRSGPSDGSMRITVEQIGPEAFGRWYPKIVEKLLFATLGAALSWDQRAQAAGR